MRLPKSERSAILGPLSGPEFRGAVSSGVEHLLHTQGVTGSNPVPRTIPRELASLQRRGFLTAGIPVWSPPTGRPAGSTAGSLVLPVNDVAGC